MLCFNNQLTVNSSRDVSDVTDYNYQRHRSFKNCLNENKNHIPYICTYVHILDLKQGLKLLNETARRLILLSATCMPPSIKLSHRQRDRESKMDR